MGEDREAEKSGTAISETAPARSKKDLPLLLATVGLVLVAAMLLFGVWVIDAGMRQIRPEALPPQETKKAQVAARVVDAGPKPIEETSTAFLGLDLKHQLPSGMLSVLVDGQVVHEANLFTRERRAFLFRTVMEGEVRAALPVEPGARRITLQIRCDELGFEAAAETTASFQPQDWRLLVARLRPEDRSLELRFR